MTASADLYAIATEVDIGARSVPHEPDKHDPRACARWCWRCYLDARARLHVRAGDSAKALEERTR